MVHLYPHGLGLFVRADVSHLASEQVVLDPNSSEGISKDVFKLIPSVDACGPDCDFLYPDGVEVSHT